MHDTSLRSEIESLLKNRQLVWAKETAALVEEEVSRSTDPLHTEITTLKQQLVAMEGQREEWIRTGEQRVQTRLHTFLDSPSAPIPHQPVVTKAVVAKTVVIKPVAQTVPNAPKKKSNRHLARPIITVITLALTGYIAAKYLPHSLAGLATRSTGQVAGASVAAPIVNKEYPESYATLPFSSTVWETLDDPDFHFHIEYPKNTSNLVRIVGGSNIWFLRNNGYIMKITRSDLAAGQTLDVWWSTNQSQYSDEYTSSKSTLNGQPAWLITAKAQSENSGNSYFIRNGASILQLWIKDEPTSSDDGQRLAHMLASFRLTT